MLIKIITFPLKLILLIPIYFYKIVISPCLPKTCIFYPTCSTYMAKSIKEFGIFKGLYLGTKRLIKCRPGQMGGFDPVPYNIKGDFKWLI